MTPIDDLRVGQWIAVCSDRMTKGRERYASFTGEPCEIVAISLPFIAVWIPRPGRGDTIDVRRYGVVRLDRKYVRVMLQMPLEDSPKDEDHEEQEQESLCPICGHKLSQRMVAGDGDELALHCSECGFGWHMP